MELNLNFLLQSADFSVRTKLFVEAIAPLSMVASLPGKYYRSQREPTAQMLYGLLKMRSAGTFPILRGKN